MSQPEHLVKVHVNNTATLEDHQLEWLISGGNVKSLDINGCRNLRRGSQFAINKFGSKLEYLRIGDCYRILPDVYDFSQRFAILTTPNVKTFIVSKICCFPYNVTNYWICLLQYFISNLEDLQISNITGEFETLVFLEPARNKLASLTLRNCVVPHNANAWASLFKLDKLRFLDVMGSSIREAFVGEVVVQRLLTAMPNLTRLVVDSGLVKDIAVNTSIRGQGSVSVAKRLEFLGVMDNNDVADLRKAKLLAKDVAYFGTVEGELRVLEYFSNLLNDATCFDSRLGLLLEGLRDLALWNTVAVIGLLMKTFKNNGVPVADPHAFFEYFKPLFSPEIWAKLGEVIQDHCIGVIFAFMSRSVEYGAHPAPVMISDVIEIMMNLEGGLRFDHYLTLVPMVMSVAERAMMRSVFDRIIGMENFGLDLLRKIAQLLETTLDRFPGEIKALWGISSVLVVIKELKDVIVSAETYRFDLLEIFGSLIASLRKLCLNSGPRRAAFHSAEGVDILMMWLTEIIDGYLGSADRDSFALLEILQSILQDTSLNLSESGMIALRLEKLLLSVHSKSGFRNSPNPIKDATLYHQSEGIASLLNILEKDPRYDYEPSEADVKEIMMNVSIIFTLQ